MAEFLAQTLQRIPQFSHLSEGQLQKVEAIAVSKSYPAYEEIAGGHEIAHYLVVVEFGHVQVLDQHKKPFYSLYRGDWFSAQAQPDGVALYSATRTKLLLIAYHELEKVLPPVAPARGRFALARLFQSVVLFILLALLALGITFGLWQLTFSSSHPRSGQWVFDPALLPYTLGEIYLAQGDRAMAEFYFRQSLGWQPEYPPGHNSLGMLLYERGLKDEAVAHWYQALETDAAFVQAPINLSSALAEQEKSSEAISFLQKAIELSPNEPGLYRRLGGMQVEQKNVLAARRAFLEASRLDDTNADTFYMLGYLYLVDKDYDRARQHFEQALALNPRLYLAEQGLGAAYFEQHHQNEALAHFKRAVILQPGDPLSLFYVGLIYENEGQTVLSKDAFSQVIRFNGPAEMIRRANGHIKRLSTPESEAEPMTQN